MNQLVERQVIAFAGTRRVAAGPLRGVALRLKELMNKGETHLGALVFDAASSEPVELDLRGTVEDVLQRLAKAETTQGNDAPAPRAPGRPRLGVVAREVTLLPRHWAWLRAQPGGASVALRKLVEHARRSNHDRDQVRRAQEVCYRFMAGMAGDLPGFEEAARALFALDEQGYTALIASWPTDIRYHVSSLAAKAFSAEAEGK
jgi:hypothetical protein